MRLLKIIFILSLGFALGELCAFVTRPEPFDIETAFIITPVVVQMKEIPQIMRDFPEYSSSDDTLIPFDPPPDDWLVVPGPNDSCLPNEWYFGMNKLLPYTCDYRILDQT